MDRKSVFLTALVLPVMMASCGWNRGGDQGKSDASPVVMSFCDNDIKVFWIKDNQGDKLMPVTLFPDASPELLDSLGLKDGIPSSVSVFAVEKGGKNILFDTGNGLPESGLLPGLASVGIAPEEVDFIFLTHLHYDHIGGMMRGDTLVFPNAKVYVAEKEYSAWMSMPETDNGAQARAMSAYGDSLVLFAAGDSLPYGVSAMDAEGHTPGHTIYRIGKVLVIGDLMHGAALQMSHPDICATYDMDKAGAVRSRKCYLEYASENGLVVLGMHLPVPARQGKAGADTQAAG